MTLQEIVKLLLTTPREKVTQTLEKLDLIFAQEPSLLVKVINTKDSLSVFGVKIDLKLSASLEPSPGVAVYTEDIYSTRHIEVQLSIEFLIKLVPLGANINVQDKHGNTALHICSNLGISRLVVQLLKAGASPDIQNNDGKLPEDLIKSATKVRDAFQDFRAGLL